MSEDEIHGFLRDVPLDREVDPPASMGTPVVSDFCQELGVFAIEWYVEV